MASASGVQINQKELSEALQSLDNMIEAIDDSKFVKSLFRRQAKTHFVGDMKRNSPSVRLAKMVDVTTSKKLTGSFGARVGVVRNDVSLFPKISAQGLASILEHGTVERFRNSKRAGIVTGRVSLGKVESEPWLRPSWDSNVEGFIRDTEDSIVRKIEKQK